MKNVSIDTITQAFVDYCSDDTDPRTMFVLKKMVEHLHAFTKETQLTHAEWARGLKFLTDAGKISNDERNEFVLISDVTGLSSLVDMIGSQHGGDVIQCPGALPFCRCAAFASGSGFEKRQ